MALDNRVPRLIEQNVEDQSTAIEAYQYDPKYREMGIKWQGQKMEQFYTYVNIEPRDFSRFIEDVSTLDSWGKAAANFKSRHDHSRLEWEAAQIINAHTDEMQAAMALVLARKSAV